jgi:uncharacterized protein
MIIKKNMLTKLDRDTLKSILSQYQDKIHKVTLFGSRATGLAKRNSDIDLVIHGSLSEADTDRLWTLFDDSSLSVPIDLIAYNQNIYPPLKQHIDAVEKLLFEKADLTS